MNQLTTAVWEITMGCNMRCKHCGSSCAEALPDELSTSEALSVCDQLRDLGLKVITLSGGEPTTRNDWPIIAKRLVDNGIVTSIITNGWLIDKNFIDNAITTGLRSVCLSIDGLQETHDFIRKPGSFKKSIKALKELNNNNVSTSVITSINKENIAELEELFYLFDDLGVASWQLQIALPMGNFIKRPEWLVEPEDILYIIDFAYNKIGSRLLLVLADCVGYYSSKDIKVNENFLADNWSWAGCGAGKHVIGILHNGDIVGCTSIRDKTLTAGNVREKSLKTIWEDNNSFSWNRSFQSDKLKGFCKECRYKERCLGGCSNSRYCINGSFESENRYCAYNVEMKNWRNYLESIDDTLEIENMIEKAKSLKHQDLLKIAIEVMERKSACEGKSHKKTGNIS